MYSVHLQQRSCFTLEFLYPLDCRNGQQRFKSSRAQYGSHYAPNKQNGVLAFSCIVGGRSVRRIIMRSYYKPTLPFKSNQKYGIWHSSFMALVSLKFKFVVMVYTRLDYVKYQADFKTLLWAQQQQLELLENWAMKIEIWIVIKKLSFARNIRFLECQKGPWMPKGVNISLT